MKPTTRQFCAVCAWRETCAKKFCVADGGARCPDFTRDISIRDVAEQEAGDRTNEEKDREKQ